MKSCPPFFWNQNEAGYDLLEEDEEQDWLNA